MRTIKFRGIREKGGEMVFGDLHTFGVKREITSWNHTTILGQMMFSVRPETVGQFTGRVDKNGVEIYEGDILKEYYTDDSGSCISEVKFLGACFHACSPRTGNIYLDQLTPERLEVLGNIHQTPSLLPCD